MIKQMFLKLFEKAHIVRGPINLNDRQGALHKAWGLLQSNEGVDIEGLYSMTC